MPRVTRKRVASKDESSSPDNRGSSQRKRGSKRAEDVAREKRQAASSKRGGRQAARDVKKSDTSVKRKAASRGKSKGGREKKRKESESEDSDEDEESEEEESWPPKVGRGRVKSSSAAARNTKAGQGSKSAGTGNIRARGKAGPSSRKAKRDEEDEEEEEDEAADEGAYVRSRSVGTRGARGSARYGSKVSKKEENQGETKDASLQGRAGKSRQGANKKDKCVDEDDDEEEEESDEETPNVVKGRSLKGRGKAVKPEEKIVKGKEDKVDSNTVKSKSTRGRALAVSTSRSEKQTTANAAGEEDSEDMEVTDETDAGEAKQESVDEIETESASSAGGKSSRGQKKEPAEKSFLSKGKVGGASTSTASGKKTETECMEISEEDASSKTKTGREESLYSEAASAEPGLASKHKLQDDQERTGKRLRLSEESESENFNVRRNYDVAGFDSQEVADLKQPEITEASQPTTPDDTSYEGPRINPFLAAPGIPVVVPLTEAELAKQYTTQMMDRDETSSIMVEVGSECASDVTGLSTRGLDVSDIVSLDSMDMSQVEAASGSSTGPTSPSASSQSTIFQEPRSVSTGDKELVILQNSAPVTASEDSHTAAAAASQLPASAANESPDTAQSHQVASIHELHAESAPVGSASSEDVSHTSAAPNQNGTVEKTPGLRTEQERLVPEIYVPSSTAIDSRKFILNPAFPVESMDPALCFSVVSYNILADCHMRRSDYSYTQPQFLDQKYRHSLLLKELDFLDGDIVCLQEVNPVYYAQLLQPDMKSRGYDGYFIKRTKEYWDEGEATFVKTSKFNVTSHQGLSLADLAFKEVDDSGLNEDISRAAKKYLDRADVIMLTELNCKRTGRAVNVCNIHVVYDLKALDVQCIQVACAIKQLVAKAGSDVHPHIICGDFNSEVTSPAYQLAKDGYLSDNHIQKLQSLQNLDITDESSRSLINHMWRAFQHISSNLKSAYEVTLGKEPPVTSFTKVTHATLDYIFYSGASLDATGVLETLDLPVVNATGGLPSDRIPSDHLSLKTVFRLK